MKAIWKEFKLVFKNPRHIHRVLAVVPLSAIISHFLYIYMKLPKGVPIKSDSIITVVLIGTIYFGTLAWVFLSNELDIELVWRFFWAAAFSILLHRIIVYDGETGGSLYYRVMAFLAFSTMLIFTVSGKTKNELKIMLNVKLNEGKHEQTTPLRSISSNADNDKHSGLG